VCACADEPLGGDPPTLYFVLDRSASMADDSKWKTIITVIGGVVEALGPRAKIGAAVFPDPHTDQCGAGIEVFAPTRGDAPAGQAGPVEATFLTQLGRLAPQGGTPTAATLAALAPHVKSLAASGKTYMILATDGGPNCNADADCDASTCELNIEQALPACSPSGSTNCCANGSYGAPTSCLDGQATADAVTQLAQNGVPVYVVGVPGSAPYADLLNQLAMNGGTARTEPPYYYAVDSADVAAFSAAISSVAASIAGSCTLTLDQPPPDPAQVNVFLDEQPLPQAGPDGWSLDGQTVTIDGASCNAIRAGSVLDVRVVAGCHTLLR
jgi:hypothetical protein